MHWSLFWGRGTRSCVVRETPCALRVKRPAVLTSVTQCYECYPSSPRAGDHIAALGSSAEKGFRGGGCSVGRPSDLTQESHRSNEWKNRGGDSRCTCFLWTVLWCVFYALQYLQWPSNQIVHFWLSWWTTIVTFRYFYYRTAQCADIFPLVGISIITEKGIFELSWLADFSNIISCTYPQLPRRAVQSEHITANEQSPVLNL